MGTPCKQTSAPERSRLFCFDVKNDLYCRYKAGESIKALGEAGGFDPLHVWRTLKSVAPAGEAIEFSSESTSTKKCKTLDADSEPKHFIDVEATVVAPEPDDANKNRKINVDQANRHLELCGIGPHDAVILCAYGGTNRYVPDRRSYNENFVWELVAKQASEGSRRYDLVEAHLKS